MPARCRGSRLGGVGCLGAWPVRGAGTVMHEILLPGWGGQTPRWNPHVCLGVERTDEGEPSYTYIQVSAQPLVTQVVVTVCSCPALSARYAGLPVDFRAMHLFVLVLLSSGMRKPCRYTAQMYSNRAKLWRERE